ncbi:sugar-binding transcriptional regulator [Oricola cellulosilytica]|uniref:Sugar-binding transcriptional regulator n=1 Tax=Oricola cellulosilytica TaxID=1429082 RepID=A0A4R0P801_9HYPH|nr:sugar-binding transcriptional regulator [Oricola cellulosilytica]TCD13171.1 sugar-binding transcriptional regulator [Oricola cellulosilytica]
MASRTETDIARLDDAARAGWLYYVAGNTQDEIAKKLGVSRQSAQRLVSLAVSEKLIKVRLDHPIAHCMELGHRLRDEFGLAHCEIVPSDPDAPSSIVGIAQAGAAEMERHLKSKHPKIIAIGTGRALRACVEQLSPMDCPQHSIVSLLGNMMSDGLATAYNVVIRMAERVNARHYPMPLPVHARSIEEKRILHNQEPVRNILELIRQADVTFVGIGNLDLNAPIFIDGFLKRDEIRALNEAGAVGEITSWVFDREGHLIEGLANDHVNSAPLVPNSPNPVFGIAAGESKVAAIRGALVGKLINGLITNEHTAELLLKK